VDVKVHIHNPSYLESRGRRLIEAGTGKTVRPYRKNKLRQKVLGACLKWLLSPNKREALSSKPSTTTKKKKNHMELQIPFYFFLHLAFHRSI
jgi:hypothetical protein